MPAPKPSKIVSDRGVLVAMGILIPCGVLLAQSEWFADHTQLGFALGGLLAPPAALLIRSLSLRMGARARASAAQSFRRAALG